MMMFIFSSILGSIARAVFKVGSQVNPFELPFGQIREHSNLFMMLFVWTIVVTFYPIYVGLENLSPVFLSLVAWVKLPIFEFELFPAHDIVIIVPLAILAVA